RESWREDTRRYNQLVADLHEKVGTQPTGALFKGSFIPVAEESRIRGDDRFEILLQRLNVRCNAQGTQVDKDECLRLHEELSSLVVNQPDPFYDYWFKDKCVNYSKAKSLPEVEVCGTGAKSDRATRSASIAEPDNKAGYPSSAPQAVASVKPSDGNAQPAVVQIEPSTAPTEASSEERCPANVRVFVHIYDEASRPYAMALGHQV